MINYPSWPCTYPETKLQEIVPEVTMDDFMTAVNQIIKTHSEPLIDSLISFDAFLDSLIKDQPIQLSLFDEIVDSAVLPLDTNPIKDLYETLGTLKVTPGTFTVAGSALVQKDIIDSYFSEPFDQKDIVDLSEIAIKFGILPKFGVLNSIVSLSLDLKDGYYYVSLERKVDINQIIF